jgi:hypothetical protein
MRVNQRTLPAASLGIAVTLLGCGTTSTPPPSGPGTAASPAEGREQISADFARQECALYEKLTAPQRLCLIARNAEAGRRWLETVSGEPSGKLPVGDRLALIQRTLRAPARLTATELADAGWYLAETLRQGYGGRYRWDASSAEIVLEVGPTPVAPMTLARQTRQQEKDLTALSLPGQPGHRPPAETPDCRGVERFDVLEHRLTRTEQR